MRLKLICICMIISLCGACNKDKISGNFDSSFDTGTGVDGWVYDIAIQNDGKIIICGYFTAVNEIARIGVARINEDGSLDETFNPATVSGNSFTHILIQSDGKIILGGDTNGDLIRLNSDGTIDATFNQGGLGANGQIYAIAIQTDGKILIGGNFSNYNGNPINHIARLNSDGTLDSSLDPGTGLLSGSANHISVIEVQADGKILIGGAFVDYNGTSANNLVRINTNGAIDGTFNIGTGTNNRVNDIEIESDGGIIIGGNFTTFNGSASNYVAALNTDGTLNDGFNPGSAASSIVTTISIQSDGKIVLCGGFGEFNEITSKGIVRINPDGSIDKSFKTGTGASPTSVYASAIQTDGKIIIGGELFSFDGNACSGIARIK